MRLLINADPDVTKDVGNHIWYLACWNNEILRHLYFIEYILQWHANESKYGTALDSDIEHIAIISKQIIKNAKCKHGDLSELMMTMMAEENLTWPRKNNHSSKWGQEFSEFLYLDFYSLRKAWGSFYLFLATV